MQMNREFSSIRSALKVGFLLVGNSNDSFYLATLFFLLYDFFFIFAKYNTTRAQIHLGKVLVG
jgi:hypothetical protein